MSPEERGRQRRIAACFKACEGISTHALEYGVVKQLIEACEQARMCFEFRKEISQHTWELSLSQVALALAKAKDGEPVEG